jgi:hypothetical protein
MKNAIVAAGATELIKAVMVASCPTKYLCQLLLYAGQGQEVI